MQRVSVRGGKKLDPIRRAIAGLYDDRYLSDLIAGTHRRCLPKRCNLARALMVFAALAALQLAYPVSLSAASGTAHLERTRVQHRALEPAQDGSFSDLPRGAAPAIARTLADELSKDYHLSEASSGGTAHYSAENPAHGMRFTFDSEGVRIHSQAGDWTWGLRLARWGYAGTMLAAPAPIVNASSTEVTYKRGRTLTEWYLNTPWGLEQGFTLSRPPPASSQAQESALGPQPVPLVLELKVAGNLQARLDGRTDLGLYSARGQVARYAGLYAVDAAGQNLPAHLELEGDTLRIVVDDRTARYPVTIDPWIQLAELNASEGGGAARLGYRVAVSGDTVVVGAWGASDRGPASGTAYVFQSSAGVWSETVYESAKLMPTDGAEYDYFGGSVAISGDVVVVGAYEDDDRGTDSGSAYVFEKPDTGWSGTVNESVKLLATDGAGGDRFGWSVAISGDAVAVGAYADDHQGADSGSAYVFEKPVAGWSETVDQSAKLVASDGELFDYFGNSVAVSGDTVIVGAYYDDDKGSASGSAYAFEKPEGGWSGTLWESAKLLATDGYAGDRFGWSVAISGDTAVVGAWGDAYWSGSAYLFEQPGGWLGALEESAKLTSSDVSAGDRFGWSVALSGDTVVVGASEDGDNGRFSGSAYVFEKPVTGWPATMEESAKWLPSDGAAYDYFGGSVAISGDNVVAGAWGDDSLAGSAYVFEKPVTGWPTTMEESAKLNASERGGGAALLGYSAAVDGDVVVVGAYGANYNGSFSGAAFVFEKPGSGWVGVRTESAKLLPFGGGPDDEFGRSVAISGDTVVVGAPGDDDQGANSGSAYVFTKPVEDGWSGTLSWPATLQPSGGSAGDGFGRSVAISGDTVVVGANFDDGSVTGSGSAYIFEKPEMDWSGTVIQSAKLQPSDGAESDQFGYSVGISGETVVVGANYGDGSVTDSGSAYIFEKPGIGWSETVGEAAKLLPSDGAAYDYFGGSTAISGDVVVVGAWGDDSQAGSAYIFEKPGDGWSGTVSQSAKLLPSDGEVGDWFGCSVGVSEDTVVVGAVYDDDNGTDSGSAYGFEQPAAGWSGTLNESAKLLPAGGAGGDGFGTAVTISPDTVVVGAPETDSQAGSAYVYGAMSIEKTAEPETAVDYHGVVTYTLVLDNSGAGNAAGVLLTDTLPSQVDFARWITGGQPVGASVIDDYLSWNGPIAAHTAITFTFVVSHVGDYGDVVSNEAKFNYAGGGDSDDASFSVVGPPELSIGKTVTPATDVDYHGEVSYTIVLNNSGAGDGLGVLLTDTLPTEVDFVEWIPGGQPGNATVDDDELIWSGTVPAGMAKTFAFVARHVGDYGEAVANTAVYSYAGGRVSDDAYFTVIGPPELSVGKTVTPATEVDYHGLVTYTILLENKGDADATSVLLTDTLPGEVDFSGWVEGGQPDEAGVSDDELTWSGTVAAHTAMTFEFVAGHVGDYGEAVANTAVYSYAGGRVSDDAYFTVIGPPELSVGKTVTPATEVDYHGLVTYTILLENTGDADATGVLLTDTLPGGVDFFDWVQEGKPIEAGVSEDELTWSGTVTAHTAITFEFVAGHVGDYSDVVSNEVDYDYAAGSGSDGVSFSVVGPPPVLSIEKTAAPEEEVPYHGPVTYTIVVENSGGGDAVGVRVTDTLPAQVEFSGWLTGGQPQGAIVSGGELTWTGTITAHTALTFTFVVSHVGDYRDAIPNEASFGHVGDSGRDDAWFNVVGPPPLLSISKIVTPATGVEHHGLVTYTVVLANAGEGDAAGVHVTDTLPGEVVFLGWLPGGWPNETTLSGDEVTWNGVISAHTAITFTFAARHVGDYGEVVSNTASFHHASGSGSHDASFSVIGPPELSADKTVTPETEVNYHGLVTYTILLENTGDADATGVLLTDTLPGEVDFSAWVQGGPPSGAGVNDDQLTWSGTVAAHTAMTFEFVAGHIGDYGEVVTNEVDYDYDAGSGTDGVSFSVIGPPVLSIDKGIAPETDVDYHGLVTYTIVVENSGGADATDVLLTDTLPAGVEFSGWVPGGLPAGAGLADDELSWTGTVAAQEAVTFEFMADHVGDYGDVVLNEASFSYARGSGSDDASFTVVGPPPELAIRKTVTPAMEVTCHGLVTYTIVVENTGAGDAAGVQVTDTLPAPVDFVGWVPGGQPAGVTVSNDELTWIATVRARSAITYSFVASHVGDYGDVVSNEAHFSYTTGGSSDEATFTVQSAETGFSAYLPIVVRNVTP